MDAPGEKLLIKMWDTLIEKGVGGLLTPWQRKREGKAQIEIRCEEVLALAQAETDADEIRAGRKALHDSRLLLSLTNSKTDTSGYGRQEPYISVSALSETSMRVDTLRFAQKEINVTKALLHAEKELMNDTKEPPAADVDQDWLFNWREYAERSSSEDLRVIWGKILAGEVKAPGTYGLRTLDFLKGVSKSEAEEISLLLRYEAAGGIPREPTNYLKSKGIDFSFLMKMQEIGVIQGVESSGMILQLKSLMPERFVCTVHSHGKVLLVTNEDPLKILTIRAYAVTTLGRQLLQLGDFEPDLEYLELLGREILKGGFSVKLGDWEQVSPTAGQCVNTKEIV